MKKFINIALFSFLLVIATTIFASCKKNDDNMVTITFDSNGGSYIESIEVEKGSKIPKPDDCTRTGYTLNGWFLDDEEWSFIGFVATEDICLKAKWSTNEYSITYNLNGGSKNGQDYPETYTIEDITLSIPEPSKLNYIFNGWYLDSDFNTKIQYIDCNLCEDITLYAEWVDTYKIDSEQSFIHFMNTPYLWNFKIEMLKDIDLNNKTITPIGLIANRFKGIFNGNGYKISNFSIDSSLDYVGFFGYAEDCVIKNLGLENCEIIGTVNDAIYCGGLVGLIGGNSVVQNCYVQNETININNSNTSHMFSSGGLIGEVLAHYSTIEITNCYTTGNLIATNGTLGGLIGALSSYDYDTYITIKNSYSACDIETNYSLGGLVGYSSGKGVKLENCFATGNLSSSGSKLVSSRIASIIRYLSLDPISISNCYSVLDREFIERGELISILDVYDYNDIVFKNYGDIIIDLQQGWLEDWDISGSLPTLKIFNK